MYTKKRYAQKVSRGISAYHQLNGTCIAGIKDMGEGT